MTRPTGHIKETYSPRMNAMELRHRERVQKQPCFGCGRLGCSAHHWLSMFHGKRWRREHKWLLPACYDCHQGKGGIHDSGTEAKWLAKIGRTEAEAIDEMQTLWAETALCSKRTKAVTVVIAANSTVTVCDMMPVR